MCDGPQQVAFEILQPYWKPPEIHKNDWLGASAPAIGLVSWQRMDEEGISHLVEAFLRIGPHLDSLKF